MEKEEELDTEEEKSDQIDLYIRWWQLNVFLPMLHFIKPPTTFPENKVSANNLAYFLLLFAGTKFRFLAISYQFLFIPFFIFGFWSLLATNELFIQFSFFVGFGQRSYENTT